MTTSLTGDNVNVNTFFYFLFDLCLVCNLIDVSFEMKKKKKETVVCEWFRSLGFAFELYILLT